MGKIIKMKNTNKYINHFKEFIGDKDDSKSIVGALSLLSAMTLGVEIDDEEIDSILKFYEYFREKYETRQDVLHAIMDNWGQFPRILKLAEEFIQIADYEHYNQKFNELCNEDKQKVNNLISYIWNFRTNRVVSIVTNIDESLAMELGKSIFKEELREYKNTLDYIIKKVFIDGGSLVFRRKDSTTQKEIINGFLIGGNEIIVLGEKQLKDAMEIQQNGKRVVSTNEIYEKAKL